MTEEGMSLSQKLDKLIEQNVEKQTKKKDFQLPFGIRFGARAKMKKNFALVQSVDTNGTVKFKWYPIEDNTVKVGETYHEVTADYVLRYKQYPLIILPLWNIRPMKRGGEKVNEKGAFSPKKNFDQAVKSGQLSMTEKFILAAIKMDLVKGKKKFELKTILIIGAVLVGGYLAAQQFGWIG